MKAIVKETQEEVDVFQSASALYKESKSIREWKEDELTFPDKPKQVAKAFLEGWIAGFKAKLEENRRSDARKLINDFRPVTSISSAATISYYNGANYVLNELEKLLNNI